ncbi:MAG TPA: LytTR family DNA-binding domain-containing protein [Chitinophagaceae bacterium]|nr:LytTR family DNA-binding domain-containing protein [Chitinophagaceae bacterium]
MIKAIIVDDEPLCCQSLQLLLEQNCPDVDVVGTYNNGLSALEGIKSQHVDLVFLDVEMPRLSGFEMLEALGSISFKLIFTTSYDKYALNAFRVSAIDFLLKPIDRRELVVAVEKVRSATDALNKQQVELLLQKINQPSKPLMKIAMPSIEGLEMVPIENILYGESSDIYTYIFLKNNKKMLVTRSLKEMEELLEEHSFIRVHRSFLVNLNEVERYVRGDGGYVMMSDGKMIDVSRSKKEELLKKLLR